MDSFVLFPYRHQFVNDEVIVKCGLVDKRKVREGILYGGVNFMWKNFPHLSRAQICAEKEINYGNSYTNE